MDGSQIIPRCVQQAGDSEHVRRPGAHTPAMSREQRGTSRRLMLVGWLLASIIAAVAMARPSQAAVPVLTGNWVSPSIGSTASAFTFRVYWSDADNQAPTRIRVWVQDPLGNQIFPTGFDMTGPLPAPTDYTTPVLYTATTSQLFDAVNDNVSTPLTVDRGRHSYYIEASDQTGGATNVILPSRAGDPLAIPPEPAIVPVPQLGPRVINSAPVLTNGLVTPTTGDPSTNYIFQVGFSDGDGNNPNLAPSVIAADGTSPCPAELSSNPLDPLAPAWYSPGVYLLLTDSLGATLQPILMTPLSNTFSTGVAFELQSSTAVTLSQGMWRYRFLAWDGMAFTYFPAAGTSMGPNVANAPPTLSNLRVAPDRGAPGASFTFTTTYTSATNTAPNGGVLYLRLEDANLLPVEDPMWDSTGQPDMGILLSGYLAMRKVNPNDINFTKGVDYTVSVMLKNPGMYRHQVSATVGAYSLRLPDPLLVPSGYATGPLVAAAPALRNAYVTPPADKQSGNSFTWFITYSDTNGLLPVGGSPMITIVDPSGKRLTDTDGTPYFRMTAVDAVPNYTMGAQFKFTRSLQTPGRYHYAFDVSNGASSVREPLLDYHDEPLVYAPPSLTAGAVYPGGATQNSAFSWVVTYTDVSKDDPANTVFPNVAMVLTAPDNTESTVLMDAPTGTGNLATGVTYRKAMTLTATGPYKFRFVAQGGTAPLPQIPPAGNFDGPVVYSSPTLTECAVTPTGDSLAGTFTWSANYKDPDNHPPSQGYPRLVLIDPDGTRLRDALNGNADYFVMLKVDPLDTNYVDGATYTFKRSLPKTGGYQFQILSTDGYYNIQFPAAPAPSQAGPMVYTPPVLSSGAVTPNQALQTTPFTWSVVYTDADGQLPAAGHPRLVLKDPSGSVLNFPMALDPTAPGGNVYRVTQAPIMPGQYSYHFEVSDGFDSSRFPAANELTDLTVDKDWSLAPQPGLDPVTITPATGMVGQTFEFSTIYKHEDRTPPVSVRIYLVDATGTLLNSAGYAMTTTDTDASVLDTVGWTYRVSLPALPAGAYGHYVLATDGHKSTRLPDSGTNPGPTVQSQQLTDPGVTVPPGSYAGDAYVFNVTYTYGANRAPSWVRLILTNPDGTNAQPIFLDTDATGDYTLGKLFTKSVVLWQPGSYSYEFQASEDGVNIGVRTAGPATIDVQRPSAATLSDATVARTADGTGRYVYSIVYRQAQAMSPQWVRLSIDIDAAGAAARTVDMIDTGKDAAGVDNGTDPERFAKGVLYGFTLAEPLAAGNHNFRVRTSTALDETVTDIIVGPALNRAPVLEPQTVSPPQGDENTLFTFTVVYKDGENTAPVGPIKLNVANATYEMVAAGWVDPSAPNYQSGARYELKTKLPAGQLSHSYVASDGQEEVRMPVTGLIAGPAVMPATKITPSLSRTQLALDAFTGISASGILDPVVDNAALTVTFAILVTQPDGTRKEEVRQTLSATTDAAGRFATGTMIPDQDGDWVVRVSYAGDTQRGSGTATASFTVAPAVLQLPPSVYMFAVPVAPVRAGIRNVITGGDFSAAVYTGDKQSPYRYDTDPAFPAITPGLGLWVRNSVTLTATASGRLVDHAQTHAIPVRPGWNLIGNPYLLPTDWNAASFSNGVERRSLADAFQAGWILDYAWTYDPALGDYRLIDATAERADRQLPAWRGAYFYSRVAGQLLLSAPTTRASVTVAEGRQRAAVNEWSMQLVASNSKRRDSFNFAGVSAQGRAIVAPPLQPGYVDLYFTGPEGRRYATEHRAPAAGEQVWNFSVETDMADEAVTVSAPNLASVPRGYEVILEDVTAGSKRTYLRTAGGYTFNPGDAGKHDFRLIVRPRSEGSLLITDVTTTTNRAGTAIGFNVTREVAATVELISPSGKVLKRIADRQAAGVGRATVVWDGTRDDGAALPAGVYLVRIIATTPEGQSAQAVKPMINAR